MPLLLACFISFARSEETMTTDGEPLPESAIVPVPSSLLPRDATLELPEWLSEDWREFEQNDAPTNLGGGLFPSQLWPLMPEPTRLPAEKPANPNSHLQSTPEGFGTEPLPQVIQDAYFGALPPESLVDPQALLDEVRQDEISSFLEEYSTRAAGIHIRVLVIGPRQKVPESVDLKKLADRWFRTDNGIVVVYPMSLPERSLCLFSTGLARRYSLDDLTDVRDACVKEAQVATLGEDQLARYCIKLAVRMNRLQQEPKKEEPEELTSNESWWSSLPTWAWWYGGAVIFTALILGIMQRWNPFAKAKKSAPWLVPEQEFTTRLGAPYSGGTAGVIIFHQPVSKRKSGSTAAVAEAEK